MEPCVSQRSDSRTLLQDLIPVLQKFDKTNQSIDDIHVTKNQFTIGRARENDEVICSMVISRHHCMLECDGNGDWVIKNFSLNGTVLNGQFLGPNVSRSISLGDVVQFSVVGDYKYFFTLRFKDEVPVKRRRTDETSQNENLSRIHTFADYQESKRKEMEQDLQSKRKEQNDLKMLLEDCLQRQETENDFIMTERINSLKSALESADQMVKILEGTYNCYLSRMDEERKEFDAKLVKEGTKLQRELNTSDKQVEKIIGQKMEKWTREHQTKWSDIMKGMMKEEKSKQEKLENENSSLAAKLRKAEEALKMTEDALREKSALAKHLQQQQAREVIDLEKESGSYSSDEIPSTSKNNLRDKVENILDEQLSCSICSEIFVNPTSLNCSHTFCQYCISSWNKKTKKANCPICRVRIKSMNQSRVFDCLIEKMVSELSSELKKRREQLIKDRRGS
ncbi:E3 ubiquitin-protein ligase RNF8 [Diachasma alloeum]|uniref:E3 ubiquitin-protein ligase RNF8 n=1 Tax=Diachasma alloeum TaxID=454923 RepID=UPI000738435E|nr:E3 ubiquitin-protein ligase RNF8 [Diachasma alloeum]